MFDVHNSDQLVVKKSVNKHGEMALSHYAAKCWKQLLIHIRTVARFKQMLKKMHFSLECACL